MFALVNLKSPNHEGRLCISNDGHSKEGTCEEFLSIAKYLATKFDSENYCIINLDDGKSYPVKREIKITVEGLE
jgi:hypothetical protein